MRAIATEPVSFGKFVTLRKRGWLERLFSWPWRPWVVMAATPLQKSE